MSISSISSTAAYTQVQTLSSTAVSQPASTTANIGPAATVELSSAAVRKCCQQ